jgi:hypothetical protein
MKLGRLPAGSGGTAGCCTGHVGSPVQQQQQQQQQQQRRRRRHHSKTYSYWRPSDDISNASSFMLQTLPLLLLCTLPTPQLICHQSVDALGKDNRVYLSKSQSADASATHLQLQQCLEQH